MPKPIGSPSSAAPVVSAPVVAEPWPQVLDRVRTTLARDPGKLPADAAGRKAWVSRETAVVATLDKDMKVLRDAWFADKIDFDTFTDLSGKVFDRHVALDRARAALAPPKAPATPGKPGTGKEACSDYMSPDLLKFIEGNQQNGLGLIGAVVLPAAALVDLATVLGKLSAACEAKPTKPR